MRDKERKNLVLYIVLASYIEENPEYESFFLSNVGFELNFCVTNVWLEQVKLKNARIFREETNVKLKSSPGRLKATELTLRQ